MDYLDLPDHTIRSYISTWAPLFDGTPMHIWGWLDAVEARKRRNPKEEYFYPNSYDKDFGGSKVRVWYRK